LHYFGHRLLFGLNQFLRQSNPLGKVVYDDKIKVLHQALELHSFVYRVQGGNLKANNEIRIGLIFKMAPLEFLRMLLMQLNKEIIRLDSISHF
jgi:UTP pyrophosphatase